MPGILDIFANHAFLSWLALGAVFLGFELATGSGWLLWPAGSATAVALLTIITAFGLAGQAAMFAALTIVTTYLGRRFLNRHVAHPDDLNDSGARLIGAEGRAATVFQGGIGRVFVDGKEWSAELDEPGSPPAVGARVRVVALLGGARLRVRAA
jgi:membrane protein implicated in regulation of membrane protease activity